MLTRIITGIVLLIVVLAGIFYLPQREFIWVAVIIAGLAAWEFASIMWSQNVIKRGLFLVTFLIIAGFEQFLSVNVILFCGTVWWFLVPGVLWHYVRTKRLLFDNWGFQFGIGLVIFIPFLVGLITLRNGFGVLYLLCGLTIVWVADIAAYFAGRIWGRHLLAPLISPKKTIEGLVGGVIAAMLVAGTWGVVFKIVGMRWLLWLTLTLVVTLWSVIGDLFESVLKRNANLKDSGNLLPGHGGIYDRIDSLTAALPIFVFGLLYF